MLPQTTLLRRTFALALATAAISCVDFNPAMADEDRETHSTQNATDPKKLEACKCYDPRMEYFDKTGGAEVAAPWSSNNQAGPGISEIVPATNLCAAKEAKKGFTNPLGRGQDPYVTLWNDRYLYVESSAGSVRVHQSNALENIHPSSPDSTSVVAWTPPEGTNYSKQIWAPEIHSINGKWYIYVAASDGDNSTHRMHVLERDDPEPMGSYVYKGAIADDLNRWAIDGTVLDWQGQLYFIWSGWSGPTNGPQNLYIAKMSNPFTISSNRVLISSPTQAWEQHGLSINEGPQVLIHDDQLFIVYSGSAFWQREYALGMLTYDGAGPLMNPSSWQKAAGPVFQQAGQVYGTGHASLTTSPDGTESWIVFHAHHDANGVQNGRDVYIQKFDYQPNGTPDFGTPIPASTLLPVPLGQLIPKGPL